MKTLPPISVRLPISSPQRQTPSSVSCAFFAEIFYAHTTKNHTHRHSLLSPVRVVLFWNIVIHLDLFIGQFILVISPYLS